MLERTVPSEKKNPHRICSGLKGYNENCIGFNGNCTAACGSLLVICWFLLMAG